MKLYCIVRRESDVTNGDTYESLKQAAEQRNVEFVTLEADNFDYVNGFDALEPGAAMYRLARGDRPVFLEAMMALRGFKGIYRSPELLLARRFQWSSALRIEAAGVPIIPTIFNVSKNEDARLKEYAAQLGGFPIIVKSSGGSHGEGVMRVDSLSSLRSVMDFIARRDSANLVLRKYIDSARHIRLVVLDGVVLDVIEYNPQSDDFRTNAAEVPSVVPRNDIDDSVKEIAVAAVETLGTAFGGVDVLIDTQGTPYVAEVNCPCNFARNQLTTGTDIAGQMVEYLIQKAEDSRG